MRVKCGEDEMLVFGGVGDFSLAVFWQFWCLLNGVSLEQRHKMRLLIGVSSEIWACLGICLWLF